MKTDNLAIWNQLERTDPEHTKPFQRPGGFRGTAIKAIYSVKKMTEMFGPCGQGWGTDAPVFTVHGDAVFCTVALWWEVSDDPRRVYGVGGDIIVKRSKDGTPWYDDEAFKKAYTDALTNALKHLGMSADVHMGMFDDNKYVQEARHEARQEAASARGRNGASPAPQPSGEHAQDRVKPAPQPHQDRGRPVPATASAGDARHEPAATTAAGPMYEVASRHVTRAKQIAKALEESPSVEAIDALWKRRLDEILTYPLDWQNRFREVYSDTRDGLVKIHGKPAASSDPDDTAEAISDLEGRNEDQQQGEML